MTSAVPIVLLPGLDGTGTLLEPLAVCLGAQRRVQVVSYPLAERLGYDELIALVRERLPEGRFVILGESFSGPVAVGVAAAERERAAGLILAASFIRSPYPLVPAALARLVHTRVAPLGVVKALLLGRQGTPQISAALRAIVAELPPATARNRIAELLRVDKRACLRGVPCPLLYLGGRRDWLITRRHAAEVVAAKPDSTVYWLDAPHMLLATHAAEAARAINQFCDAVSGKGGIA